jgi:hypothetical protein
MVPDGTSSSADAQHEQPIVLMPRFSDADLDPTQSTTWQTGSKEEIVHEEFKRAISTYSATQA